MVIECVVTLHPGIYSRNSRNFDFGSFFLRIRFTNKSWATINLCLCMSDQVKSTIHTSDDRLQKVYIAPGHFRKPASSPTQSIFNLQIVGEAINLCIPSTRNQHSHLFSERRASSLGSQIEFTPWTTSSRTLTSTKAS